MNTVILNGQSSADIQGLLIQSLPNISKPLMRTIVEEIDGRDGDVITNLGYSAYDREMSIGLFGNYDVDEVIRFFDSEGVAIFSNEPDKFYYYKIIQQIDFERLLRFKTATVTFHVQPFKYSAVDDAIVISKNRMGIKRTSVTKNGVTASVESGLITLSGRASARTELYIPIDEMTLKGTYGLHALTEGTGGAGCKVRVIYNLPSDQDSFGGTYLALSESGESVLYSTITESETYRYIWIYIESNTDTDFTLDLQMMDENLSSFSLFNRGNTFSRPTMTIYGSGDIALAINGEQRFEIDLGDSEYITLDGADMNAYKGEVLMNRHVSGDYNNLVLNVGKNTISWTGDVTRIEVEKVTRWI